MCSACTRGDLVGSLTMCLHQLVTLCSAAVVSVEDAIFTSAAVYKIKRIGQTNKPNTCLFCNQQTPETANKISSTNSQQTFPNYLHPKSKQK
jgi:hypothetical protein